MSATTRSKCSSSSRASAMQRATSSAGRGSATRARAPRRTPCARWRRGRGERRRGSRSPYSAHAGRRRLPRRKPSPRLTAGRIEISRPGRRAVARPSASRMLWAREDVDVGAELAPAPWTDALADHGCSRATRAAAYRHRARRLRRARISRRPEAKGWSWAGGSGTRTSGGRLLGPPRASAAAPSTSPAFFRAPGAKNARASPSRPAPPPSRTRSAAGRRETLEALAASRDPYSHPVRVPKYTPAGSSASTDIASRTTVSQASFCGRPRVIGFQLFPPSRVR
jgi:hypothetical protein